MQCFSKGHGKFWKPVDTFLVVPIAEELWLFNMRPEMLEVWHFEKLSHSPPNIQILLQTLKQMRKTYFIPAHKHLSLDLMAVLDINTKYLLTYCFENPETQNRGYLSTGRGIFHYFNN